MMSAGATRAANRSAVNGLLRYSPSFPAHVGQDGLAAQEGAGEVHVEDAAPLLFVQVLHQLRRGDARVVHQDVDPAEVGHGLAHQGVDLVGLADVCGHRDGPPAPLLNGFRGRCRTLSVDIGHGHGGAGFGQHGGDARANPGTGSGDNGHPARQLLITGTDPRFSSLNVLRPRWTVTAPPGTRHVSRTLPNSSGVAPTRMARRLRFRAEAPYDCWAAGTPSRTRTASTPPGTRKHARCQCASPVCDTDGVCRRRRSSPSCSALSTAHRVSLAGTRWVSPSAARGA